MAFKDNLEYFARSLLIKFTFNKNLRKIKQAKLDRLFNRIYNIQKTNSGYEFKKNDNYGLKQQQF